MSTFLAKNFVTKLLNYADVTPNGSRAWDIKINDDKIFNKLVFQKSLALGETYMEGWWDCDAIDILIYKLHLAKLGNQINKSFLSLFNRLAARVLNYQTKHRSLDVAHAHYNLDNELY